MARRSQFVPWKAAGRVSERQTDADDVVRTTGWVFNNETGQQLTLESFVATGDEEVGSYLHTFGLDGDDAAGKDLVEIGSGIGRMTCAFTKRFRCVTACDLDAGFLERCRESVARFGRPKSLRTLEVADGRTIRLPDDSADVAFSFITLQHCRRDHALALTTEAVRAVRSGGRIALNYRRRSPIDAVLVPVGSVVRTVFKIPGIGTTMSRHRSMTRLAWQANRLAPHDLVVAVGRALRDVEVWHNPHRAIDGAGATTRTMAGVNPSHWWLVATVA
ncbi:MAG: class I SAM-dependent methyltransferase [Ilumatobacteraceae bacterium]